MTDVDVAIVGAGFSGVLLSWHLTKVGIDCALIGEDATFGRGRAYSTVRTEHLLNVPLGGMSAFPDEVGHFRDWLAAGNIKSDRSTFMPRTVFGLYLADILKESGAARIADIVAAAAPSGEGWALSLQSRSLLTAGRLVLATGHRPPRVPAALRGLGDRLIADPYQPGALETLPAQASLLLIGTGLTAVDVLATLHVRRHRGPIVTTSRNGRWPATHNILGERHVLRKRPEPTATAYVKWVRNEIERAGAPGCDWRRAVEAVRGETQSLWHRLPCAEQARLLRHARNLWDVARHQMPPPSAVRLNQLRQAGQLIAQPGRISAVSAKGDGFAATILDRHGQRAVVDFDIAVLCAGTDNAPRADGDHLLDRLLRAGHLCRDAHGIGVLTDMRGRCLIEGGGIARNLYALGPLRRGTLWENIAVPELRGEAAALAGHLAGEVVKDRTAPAITPV